VQQHPLDTPPPGDHLRTLFPCQGRRTHPAPATSARRAARGRPGQGGRVRTSVHARPRRRAPSDCPGEARALRLCRSAPERIRTSDLRFRSTRREWCGASWSPRFGLGGPVRGPMSGAERCGACSQRVRTLGRHRTCSVTAAATGALAYFSSPTALRALPRSRPHSNRTTLPSRNVHVWASSCCTSAPLAAPRAENTT